MFMPTSKVQNTENRLGSLVRLNEKGGSGFIQCETRYQDTQPTTACMYLISVFPLFEPINEKKWAYGWELDVIYPTTAQIEEGMVFKTRGHDLDEKIWTISKFDKKQFLIEYINIEPGSKLCKIQIQCKGNSDNSTTANVTYRLTALSEKGNDYIDTFTDKYYEKWIVSWQKAIHHYLETGTILKKPH